MSKIDIKVDTVRSINKDVNELAKKVRTIKTGVASVQHGIDYQIRSRGGIDNQINKAVSDLNDLEHQLTRLYQFIETSMDLYIKTDDKVKSEIPERPEEKSWWEQLLDGFDAAGDFIAGVVKGLVDVVISTLEGIWQIVTNPIETAKGLIYMVTHPLATLSGFWKAIKASWNNDVINGDAESRGKWFGQGFGEIALAIVGTKGVDKAVKLMKGAKIEETADGVKISKASNDKQNDIVTPYEPKYTRTQLSHLKSFEETKFPQVLQEHGITRQQFQELKLKPVDQLTPEEVQLLKAIRLSVDPITSDTLIQKVIPEKDIQNYLNGKYTTVGGYVAKAEDVVRFRQYQDLLESLRLDYLDWNGNRPFPDDGDTYGVIRFKTDEIDEINVPFGAKFDVENPIKDGPPCTQNGFLGGRNNTVVPEFRFNEYFSPTEAELYITVNGKEKLIGYYDVSNQRFRPFEG